MMRGSSNFNLEAIILDTIIYIILHKAIGLYLSGVLGSTSSGINAMKVAFNPGNIHLNVCDSSTTCQTSSLIKSQKLWKKFEVNPFGPGALLAFNWCTAFSTSWRSMGQRRSWLCSSVMSLGMFFRILLIAGDLSMFGSWRACLK